jgi:hypothetical protein
MPCVAWHSNGNLNLQCDQRMPMCAQVSPNALKPTPLLTVQCCPLLWVRWAWCPLTPHADVTLALLLPPWLLPPPRSPHLGKVRVHRGFVGHRLQKVFWSHLVSGCNKAKCQAQAATPHGPGRPWKNGLQAILIHTWAARGQLSVLVL